ncbi:hypothetical protein EJB05_54753, partial [Eragrostis curvula]
VRIPSAAAAAAQPPAAMDRDGRPGWLTSLGLAFLSFNSGMAIYRSIHDPYAVAFIVVAYIALILLFRCLHLLERNAPGRRGRGLKATVWGLATLLTVMFSYKSCRSGARSSSGPWGCSPPAQASTPSSSRARRSPEATTHLSLDFSQSTMSVEICNLHDIFYKNHNEMNRGLQGDMNEHESLVAACKQADVVISAVGHRGPEDLEDGQLKIVAAIKEAGNIKRFVPSEYGCDVDQAGEEQEAAVEPARSILLAKHRVREAVREAGIPHTFICSYWAHGFVLPRLGDPQIDAPPTTKVTVFGDDKTRVIFVHEKDMSMLVMRAVEDPRTLNKILYVRPPANVCSFSHLVSLWEDKIGRSLDKYHMPQEELLKRIQESPFPLNFQLAMVHATVAAGVCDQAINESTGVEATQLYPDFNFATVHDYMDSLLLAAHPHLINHPTTTA